MNILYCKDLWWPFGSHLIHIMHRKIYSDMYGYKLLYTQNNHAAYSLYGGRLSEFFASISDIDNKDIIEFADKNYFNADHGQHFLLKYTDEEKFVESIPISYTEQIDKTAWHTFKPNGYNNIEDYRSNIMKKLGTPSENIIKYLEKMTFIQEVAKLNGDYIAAHIRWTDKISGWCTEADFYDVDVYFKYALELRDKTNINNIVICCDNIDALNKMQDYNLSNNLSFNIYYDEEEVLPKNDWRECIFQKWANHSKDLSKEDFIKDFLNGFKIYKALFESKALIGNLDSNMCLVPFIARNCELDINITGNPTGRHGISNPYWSENIISKRLKGNEIRKQEFRNDTFK